MPVEAPRERMRAAAFALFEERGYDATTVGDLAEAAGVGRTTFFRAFGSKEDVIFPDHDALLHRVCARLAATSGESATPLGVLEASRIVLDHYLAEGDLARARYRLTRSVPALRDRELAMTTAYQRAFRDALRAWTGEEAGADLRAEVVAGAVTTAHNHVLRRWLRGLSTAVEARAELVDALDQVLEALGRTRGTASGSTVVVLRSDQDPETVLPALREALREARTES